MYGKRNKDFVQGVLVGIAFYHDYVDCFGTAKNMKDALKEAIEDLAENPEDFNIEEILEKGYI
jgi:hypothetical protein